MKTYKVRSSGNLPASIQKMADQFNGQPVTKDLFYVLDQDIEFYVVECGDYHGNTSADKSGWMNAKDSSWSINFDVV